MHNLLLTEAAYRPIADRLGQCADRVRVLRMQPDGTVQLDGRSVDAGDYPVALGWLSGDLAHGTSARHYVDALRESAALTWVQTVSAGLDNPLFRSLVERGVRLTNSDAQAPAIAEYVVGAVLHRFQSFPERLAAQQAARWKGNTFREIHGSRWLIVGFGNIGRRIGRIVRSFDGAVTGVKRAALAPGATNADADRIITFDELARHVGQADVVVLSCALSDQTRDLFDAALIAAIRPGAVFVNIARGELVDEIALLDALDRGALDYAILDVFRQEPLPPGSPFWTHPRVLVTPHASNRGAGTGARAIELFLGNLTAWLDGKPLRNEVDATFF